LRHEVVVFGDIKHVTVPLNLIALGHEPPDVESVIVSEEQTLDCVFFQKGLDKELLHYFCTFLFRISTNLSKSPNGQITVVMMNVISATATRWPNERGEVEGTILPPGRVAWTNLSVFGIANMMPIPR
jgi:hypothetical protein